MGDAMVTMSAWRLEDGRRWIEAATDWQVDDAQAVLEPGPDDPRLHWLGRPKGGSKTTDVAGMAMAWLLDQAAPLDEGYVIASDSDQAKRLLGRAKGLIQRTPAIGGKLKVLGDRIEHRTSGASVIALAADAAGAEGLVSPLILVDEAPQWASTKSAKDMWTAAYSSITKVPDMRLVVIGHAGIKGTWQHKLWEAFADEPLWRIHDVPGPLPATWVRPDYLELQRRTLVPSQFLRRHHNVWSSSEDALTTVDDLRQCVVLNGPMPPRHGIRYVIGLDLGVKKDRTVAAVCHSETMAGGDPITPTGQQSSQEHRLRHMVSLGLMSERDMIAELGGALAVTQVQPVRIVLDRLEVWQGSRAAPVNLTEVEEWVGQAHYSYNRAVLVADPWQAIGMGQRLAARGVEVDEFNLNQGSNSRLASVMFQLLRTKALALPDDPDLLEELATVRIYEKASGLLKMDHDAGSHDDRASAIAMAAQKLLQGPPPPRPATMTEYTNGALTGSR